MRLKEQEIITIKKIISEVFGDSKILLFGSRVDEAKAGGDIDLYIIPKNKDNLFEKKLRAKTKLEDALFKPVDIIVARDKSRKIEQEALNKGIEL